MSLPRCPSFALGARPAGALAPLLAFAGLATLFAGPAAPRAEGLRLNEQALLPYTEHEPLRTAQQLLESGKAPQAAAALVESGAPQARFLRARALSISGEEAEAAALYLALAPDYPELAHRCLFEAGAAFERAARHAEAAGAYRAVAEGSSVLAVDARRGLARQLLAGGKIGEAIDALEPIAQRAQPAWGEDEGAEALYAIAQWRERSKERALAAEAWLKLWSAHPRSPRAKGALANAQRLGRAPTLKQELTRAELRMEGSEAQPVMREMEVLLSKRGAKLAAEELCSARFILGKALRKQRRHEDALPHLEAAVESCREARDGVTEARALFVAGTSGGIIAPARGAAHYLDLAARHPESTLADDALFNASELLLRAGRYGEAREALLQLAARPESDDYRREGLFKLAFLERSQGKLQEALGHFDVLERDEARGAVGIPPAGGTDLGRAAYWRARLLLELGREEEGLGALEGLALARPASFYGFLSRAKLAEGWSARSVALSARLSVDLEIPVGLDVALGELAKNREFIAGLELLRLGLEEEAMRELRAVDRAKLGLSGRAEELRALVLLLERQGDARLAYAIARTRLAGELMGSPTVENARLMRTAWPLTYHDVIDRYSREAGIEPFLLQALAREESGLDPRARSPVGALGLCQLMPRTAAEVARGLKVQGKVTSKLHEPELNVRLGATYLSRLLSSYEGNAAFALAAYNAGPGAVRRWRTAMPTLPIDEFIEEIPISETRHYVKRVLSSYAAYQLTYGGQLEPRLGASLFARR